MTKKSNIAGIKIKQKVRYIPFSEQNVPIRIDGVFKIVFGNTNNKKYLKEFLEAVLHRKINSIMIVEPEKLLGKEHLRNKDMKIDLLVQFDNNEIIDIEIQNKNEYDIFDRSIAYMSGLLYNDYNTGDKYGKGKKTIIWILDYNLPESSDNYHEIFTYKNENSTMEIKSVEHHFIQLPLFTEQLREIKTEEEQWLAYFSGQLNPEEKEELLNMSRTIKEIDEIVEAVMTDPEVSYALNLRMRERIDEVLAKRAGYRENQIQTAKELLKLGLSIEDIVTVTKLSEEEIRNLK